ncbi:MAG: beta-carotene ketolase, partial [Pseudomonadota bacterium]
MGLLYAGLLAGVWLVAHAYAVFFHTIGDPVWLTVGLIALQVWLYTGLFIVAHDTMHGSFAPGRPRLNAWVGRV